MAAILVDGGISTELIFVDRSESLLVAAFTAEPQLAGQLMNDDLRCRQFETVTFLQARGAGRWS